jgi:hypothetical protein
MGERAEEATGKPGVERMDEYTVECQVWRSSDVARRMPGTGLDIPSAS